LTWRILYDAFLSSVKTSGMIIFMIGVSSILSWIMSFTGIPTFIAEGFLSLTDSGVLILLMMNIVLLIMGCIMDPTPAVLIFTPIFLPIAVKLGINPIHFGVIMVFNLCVGTITPPVGPILFTGCKIADLKIENVFKHLLPYFIVEIAILLLITFVPVLSMYIPTVVGLVK